MESELNELFRLEQIFNRTLLTLPNVGLWGVYLDYVRRRNPLSTDTSGQARRTISSAYDLALQYVGMDKDSGNIWNDYVEFIRSGPGTIGGSGWQDQQKMDLLRKAYQKAICVPTQAVNTLWKEYDQFEMGLNKLTVRLVINITSSHANFSPGPEISARALAFVHDCSQLVHRTAKYHPGFGPHLTAETASCSRIRW